MVRLLAAWLLAALAATTVIADIMIPFPRREPNKPSKDTYFVSAPKQIIPGTVFSVSVAILKESQVEVTAALQEKVWNTSRNSYDKRTLQSKKGVFSRASPGDLDFALNENFQCENCELLIQGRGSEVFERSSSVSVQSDILSIFIQTDKAIYKPGQRVRYRAFAVYQDLQMYKGTFSLEIREPSNNRMKVESGLSDPSGVIEGSFDLSDNPPFGDWSIKVKSKGNKQSETQLFTVAQYELPRFEVTVDLPSYAMLHDESVSGTVTAKYTYGKPVKGMVDLHVGPNQGPDSCGNSPKTVNVGFEIDGEGKFTMPLSSIRRVLSVYDGSEVKFTAYVTESATGVKLEGSNVIRYHDTENAISYLTSTPSVFKPGLTYTAHVQVKKPDGSPPDERRSQQITIWAHAEYRVTVPNQSKYGVSDFSGTYALPKVDVPLPASGIATFNVDIPKNATKITIKADYQSISTTKVVSKTYSKSNRYIQLTIQNTDVQSGTRAQFQIKSTDATGVINYQVISRNVISKQGTVNGQGQEAFTFDLLISEDMGPVATLLVYYIHEGEVVADSISFNVDGIFKNKVSVGFNAERAQPNQDIKLTVSADPRSKVFLLAVDESVLLLKSGNDISTSKVQSGIADKSQMDSDYALSLSASNFLDVFSKSGMMVITDVTLPTPPRPRNNYGRRFRGPSVQRAYGGDMEMFDMDFDSHSGSGPGLAVPPLKEVKRIRNKFPEAWLWTDVSTNTDGTYTVETKVPDTITTWVASAFATNDRTGLGVAATKANMTVFRSFFVSLTYPSSLKRNEQAVVQATVFNYLSSSTYVTVSLTDSTGFEHVVISGDVETVATSVRPQRVWVQSNSHGVVYFPIVGKEVGVFDIEVKAQSSIAADGVRRQISIEPEGAPNSYNRAIYIESSTGSIYNEKHSISFPEYAVPGSKKITVGLSGDLIGPSFNNIDDLLSMPTGCGEQSMIRLTPNLYIAKYLKSTGQLTRDVEQEMVKKLSAGYQSQLSYRRSDASFSAFGNNDESGSTWLTAYVSRVLSEAREFTYVDPNLLIGAVEWLVDRQRNDGAFVELGNVIDRSTQGKSTGPALTAYVLLTLRQNRDLISAKKCEKSGINCHRVWKWNNATANATSYLEKSINSIQDPFSLSLVTYALTEVRSRQFFRAFRKLKGMAASEGGLTCWKGNSTLPETTPAVTYRNSLWRPPTPTARPIDTLITSYALMAFTSRGQVKQALPIVKCLTQQKNFRGGFASTQDTSVALQALSSFATLAHDPNNQMAVTFGLAGQLIQMDINRNNMLNYQIQEFTSLDSGVPTEDYDVELNAYSIGTGTALAEINYSFNSLEMPDSDAFDVSTVLLDDKLDTFNLMICTKWLKSGKTGMVVQEIEIPSGFEPDLGTIGSVVGMKRYERRGNMAVVYFDEIVKTSTCYSILMSRKAKVAKTEQTFIHTFNYYNPDETSTVFYHPRSLKQSKICDVCQKCCFAS